MLAKGGEVRCVVTLVFTSSDPLFPVLVKVLDSKRVLGPKQEFRVCSAAVCVCVLFEVYGGVSEVHKNIKIQVFGKEKSFGRPLSDTAS